MQALRQATLHWAFGIITPRKGYLLIGSSLNAAGVRKPPEIVLSSDINNHSRQPSRETQINYSI